MRKSLCVYDAAADQRRKIANQKNMQELAEKQADLEKHQQLLGGILATIRAGGSTATEDLIRSIRSEVDLSQLAAHVRNECRTNFAIQQAYDKIEFVINGGPELPSPSQLQVLPGESLTTSLSREPGEGDSDASSSNLYPTTNRPTAMERHSS
jgi:hypothetical protein